MGDCLCFSHHDATLMLGVFCCAPGRDVLWSSDLYVGTVGCCFVYFCLSFPDQDATLWWWGAVVLSFSQYDANILPCWWEAAFHPHIMMQLWCWGCSAVPQGQMCFDVVVYIWGLFFSVFFLSHIRMHLWGWLVVFLSCSHHDATLMFVGVLLCLSARCVLIWWSMCVFFYSVFFLSSVELKLFYCKKATGGFAWARYSQRLGMFCCAPLGQMCFDKVINMCVILCAFVFLIKMQLFPDQDATLVLMGGCLSFSLTLWCNSDGGGVLLCPWARCVLMWWSICGLLFCVFFSFPHQDATLMLGVFCCAPG